LRLYDEPAHYWKYHTENWEAYAIFELPSNVVIRRVGARRWLSFLICAWGCIILGIGFVDNWRILIVLRTLLGVFESGGELRLICPWTFTWGLLMERSTARICLHRVFLVPSVRVSEAHVDIRLRGSDSNGVWASSKLLPMPSWTSTLLEDLYDGLQSSQP
jgi:hypothetical protein